MYSRVTLLEIDAVRVRLDEAVELFKTEVLPQLRELDGYEGVFVLTTPDGKGMIISLWATEEASAAAGGFAAGELERHMTLFKAPPGRERYEVAFAEMPAVYAG